MGALDYIALVMPIITVVLIISLLWYLAALPGRVAKARNHPHQQAITVGGWATLLLLGAMWPLVLMWAYVPSAGRKDEEIGGERTADFRDEIQRLREEVRALSASAVGNEEASS